MTVDARHILLLAHISAYEGSTHTVRYEIRDAIPHPARPYPHEIGTVRL